ncbi:hypothetical protein ANN_22204 [Periplaneta americana]|uniref:Uncharacterized protein n=1 Tax=Periplaneta americana TaxID=6978 RepID=A0ABQ8S7P0_PERAM|nr:hypothetical protein ANN_22204 [Periplaneta americana]
MYPEIPLPPKPILTRWGTWLEAVEYYAEHIDSFNNVLLALNSEDAVSIDTAKTVTCDISVKNDLAHIQHTFSCIIKTLKSLQNRHLSLSESFEIINSTVEQLNRGRGKVADAVRAKVDTVLSKNPGYEELQKVVAVMSGESTVKINLDLSPADIVKLNYVPVTSCDVERSFSQYKSILRDNRRRFTFQHLKEMLHQLLVYADGVTMLGENPQTIRENTEILLEASKAIGLEVNPEKTKVFENKALRKIFGAKRDEVTGEWRKLHNTELHALYSSPDIIRNIKSRRLRWAGHVAPMGESRNAYRVLVGRSERKRHLWRGRDVDEPLRDVRFRTVPDILQAVGRSIRNANRTGAATRTLRLPHRWQRVVDNAGYQRQEKCLSGLPMTVYFRERANASYRSPACNLPSQAGRQCGCT